MKLSNHFIKFVREIRLTDSQKEDLQTGYKTLKSRLIEEEDLSSIIVSCFLQGSYRRATAVRPSGNRRADVDLVVVTRIDKSVYPDPNKAMDKFEPFLKKHYSGKFKRQGRSFGIELSYVDLDLVITSAPTEVWEVALSSVAAVSIETVEDAPTWRLVPSWIPISDRDPGAGNQLAVRLNEEKEWNTEPLWIPDRTAGVWTRTHPLEQMKWTWGKNARCNQHYVNVVKALKWWQLCNDRVPDSPKGYPLEHLIGECCPDSIQSVAEGVVGALETIVERYAVHVSLDKVPMLSDRGVPEHNVLGKLTPKEFADFYKHAGSAAILARQAMDAETAKESAEKWRELFGDKFPPADDDGGDSDDPKGPFVAPVKGETSGDTKPRRYA